MRLTRDRVEGLIYLSDSTMNFFGLQSKRAALLDTISNLRADWLEMDSKLREFVYMETKGEPMT